MPEWDSEIEVGEDLARTLIARQFSELDVSVLRRLGEGWDNTVWVTVDGVAFRFPRREVAIRGIEREIAILPKLAHPLPAQIPDASYPGAVTTEFPWPWFGSPLIVGEEVALASLNTDRRGKLASDLGRFLRVLHGVRSPICESLERDPMSRGDMAARVPRTRLALAQVTAIWDGAERATPILDAAEGLTPDAEAVIVHGDLHQRHVLVSESGGLAGVIDWGDMCQAPRSADIPLYWSLFDTQARAAFRVAYGPITENTLLHARVLALFFDATLALYAHDKGMKQLEEEALRGLNRTLID